MEKIFNPLDYPVLFSSYDRKASTFWAGHVPFAMFLVGILTPKVIVELGTLYGVSYCAFCQAVKELKLDTRCYAVDTWHGDPHQGMYDDVVLDDLRRYHDPLYSNFSTLIKATFDDASLQIEDASVDLLHIDGYHTYEAVKHDFETWLPKLSENGVVIFHDTNEMKADFGVWKFWRELTSIYPNFEFLHSSGLGIVAVGKKYPLALNHLFNASALETVKIRSFFESVGKGVDLSIKLDELTSKQSEASKQLETDNSQLRSENAQLVTRNIHLSAQLSAIQNRFVYKFLSLVRRFIESLLPVGTARRDFFVRFYRTIRALPATGFRGALYELRGRQEIALPDEKEDQLAMSDFDRTFNDSQKEPAFENVYKELIKTSRNIDSYNYVPLTDDVAPETLVKLIAFYLPQFHPIPENDAWWGRGFTEWSNVSKAIPQFEGHYQPHLPGELGFYDLRVPEVQRRQVELARKYGIHGFCFYYYWFHGKRLLEHPLEQFVNDPEIDFPFCICWANENWTRRWDGQENDILIGQEHSIESDMDFIRDVVPILQHKNYIRINNRPVLIVYRANILPDPSATAERWKQYCRNMGIAEPYLIAAQTFNFQDPRSVGFDAAVEFPPHNISQNDIKNGVKLLNPSYQGHVFDYTDAAHKFSEIQGVPEYKLFKTIFPSWDNEPRKPGRGYTFSFSTPSAYQEWLQKICQSALKNENIDERLVFINAWNEWGEGAHLEPDRRYGYAYLQATADALRALALQNKN